MVKNAMQKIVLCVHTKFEPKKLIQKLFTISANNHTLSVASSLFFNRLACPAQASQGMSPVTILKIRSRSVWNACCNSSIEAETAQLKERVWSCSYASAIGVLREGSASLTAEMTNGGLKWGQER